MALYIEDPVTGDVLVDGDIECELRVVTVSADDGSLVLGAEVTEVEASVLDFLADADIEDPTGEQIYTLTLADLGEDDGVTLEFTDDGVVSAPDELPYDVELALELGPVYTHSPYGGTLIVATTFVSRLGSEYEVEEEFELEGGIDPPPEFKRGDASGDNVVTGLGDGLFLLLWQFTEDSPAPGCMAAADANGDGSVTGLGDGLFVLFWQFVDDSPAPPDPGPTDCGPDPDDAECKTPPDCT